MPPQPPCCVAAGEKYHKDQMYAHRLAHLQVGVTLCSVQLLWCSHLGDGDVVRVARGRWEVLSRRIITSDW